MIRRPVPGRVWLMAGSALDSTSGVLTRMTPRALLGGAMILTAAVLQFASTLTRPAAAGGQPVAE